MTYEEALEILANYDIATDNEICLVTSIIGHSLESLEKILYSRTGYRDFETYIEEDDGEENINEIMLESLGGNWW